MLIGFCGKAQSGKDAAADYLVEKYGFVNLSFSVDVLDHELKLRGMEITKMNRSHLGDELRKIDGMDVLAQRLAEKAKQYNKVVISNFRSPEEVDYFRKNEKVVLIFVNAPLEVRFTRRSKLDPAALEEFKERDERDIKLKGMAKVFEQADYTVDTSGSFENTHVQLDKIMGELL